MTNPGDGLDLSILAQVNAQVEDAAPTIPAGSQDRIKESPRDRTLPRTDTGTRPRGVRPPQPRSGRARQEPAEDTSRVVRDETAPPEYRPGVLVRPLTEMYVAIGMMLQPFNVPVATAMMQNAEPCAQSLDNLAKTNPAVRRALMSLLQTGAWGQVIAAHMPIFLALAVTLNPAVRAAMNPQAPPDEDTNVTANPVSNGYATPTQMRQP